MKLKATGHTTTVHATKKGIAIGNEFHPNHFNPKSRKQHNQGKTAALLRQQLRIQRIEIRKLNTRVKAIERGGKNDAVSKLARHKLYREIARYAELEWKIAMNTLRLKQLIDAKRPVSGEALKKREQRFMELTHLAQEKKALFENFTSYADTIWKNLERKNFKD